MSPQNKANEQLVIFAIDSHPYGLQVSYVSEIIRMVHIDPLPDSPRWMLGVVNLRGQILPIIDLRLRLGIQESPIEPATPIIITRDHGHGQVGIVVDSVDDMAEFDRGDLETSSDSRDLQGLVTINGRIVMLLGLSQILPDTRKVLHG